jgi:hypothetical protein
MTRHNKCDICRVEGIFPRRQAVYIFRIVIRENFKTLPYQIKVCHLHSDRYKDALIENGFDVLTKVIGIDDAPK